jgi:hypothetical protein
MCIAFVGAVLETLEEQWKECTTKTRTKATAATINTLDVFSLI